MGIKRIVTLLVLVLAMPALAGPRKVLVLPVDGDADPALRTRLTQSVQKLARVIDGQVQTGDTTFSDTAAVVGCDPATPACSENVRSMLAVDELVYATATTDAPQVTLVVRRKVKGTTGPRELTITISSQDTAEKIEPSLLPLFSGPADPKQSAVVAPTEPTTTDPATTGTTTTTTTTTTDPNAQVTGTAEPVTEPAAPAGSRMKRNLAIAGMAGGGVLFLIGLSLWSSKSDLQGEIDNHPTDSREDFEALQELESKASSRAWTGNVFVLVGLGLAGYSGWTFYQDRKARRAATLAPTPVEGGAGVTLTFVGDLP